MADDRDLGFVEAVADAFSFLVDRYGFEMKTPAPTLVEFGSPAVLLRVYHGRQSYEINVELNPRTEWKQGVAPFTISDVLRVGGWRLTRTAERRDPGKHANGGAVWCAEVERLAPQVRSGRDSGESFRLPPPCD